MLRQRELLFLAGTGDCCVFDDPRRLAGAQRVNIEANAVADAPSAAASIAEGRADDSIRMPGADEHRSFDLSAPCRQSDHVTVNETKPLGISL